MKIDLFGKPPALKFGKGEDAFELYVRPFDDLDRTRLIDASSHGLTALQQVVNGLVMGWSNVCNADGTPAPFERLDERGQAVSNLAPFLARLPLAMQLEVLAGVMALLGIPSKDLVALARTLPGGAAVDPKASATPPTPASDTPASASSGS